jgi:hypothetical protein
MFALLFTPASFITSTSGAGLLRHLPLLVLAAVGSAPLCAKLGKKLYSKVPALVVPYDILLFLACSISLIGKSYNPFMYFRF